MVLLKKSKHMIFSLVFCNIDLYLRTYETVDVFSHTTISLKISNTSILSTRPMWSLWRYCLGCKNKCG